MSKCLNVIALYDNYEEVADYISSVREIAGDEVDIALVINKDSRGRAGEFEESGTRLRIFDFGENVGYLNALLKVIKDPRIDLDDYAYVILSNTDILFPQRDFFQRLLEYDAPSSLGCLAPDVVTTSNQTHSNPHYRSRIPKSKYDFLIGLFAHPHLARMYMGLSSAKSKLRKGAPDLNRQKVYAPHGSYMIFTRDFIEGIRGYEYGALLYSEEACVAELLAQGGFDCLYDPDFEVLHNVSTVTGSMNQKRRFEMWRDSLVYIRDTFYADDPSRDGVQ